MPDSQTNCIIEWLRDFGWLNVIGIVIIIVLIVAITLVYLSRKYYFFLMVKKIEAHFPPRPPQPTVIMHVPTKSGSPQAK